VDIIYSVFDVIAVKVVNGRFACLIGSKERHWRRPSKMGSSLGSGKVP
jgi:hypothetical protein